MKSTALIPVEEYLRTAYSPDCDYIDGEVQERNLGERDHSSLQGEILHYFLSKRRQWKTHAFVEQRVQVSPTRFRIPDVCVMLGEKPRDQIFQTPPFICIEVLSPEDRWPRMHERINDYLKFGVPYVWVIDPVERGAWAFSKEGQEEVAGGVLRTANPALELPLSEIFAELDS